MSASIDVASISSKVRNFIQSKEGKQKFKNIASVELQLEPEKAADAFISVLKSAISSSGLSADAISAVSNINRSSARHVSGSDSEQAVYEVTVSFGGNLSRPSLDPKTYGDINDIVLLLNDGVDHVMKPVYGTWHGKDTWSRTQISGAQFIESAIATFMGSLAAEYGVMDISVSK
nr:MAG TPA: hypothetical protein [Caudoviricetes sp.]